VPLAINQGFIAMQCTGVLGPQFVLQWTRNNMDEILSRAGGTTFAEISKSAFRPIPIAVPSGATAKRFEEVVRAMHEMLVANVRESETLGTLRDALLPKLLAGEVRLRCDGHEVEALL
jgi:type I restriction enzyme S subunit